MSGQSTVHTAGTHRVCAPEITFARCLPLLEPLGVTRLADVTWLDSVGIPVYAAVRPLGKSLSQSMGKGITPLLAKVSALMEAFEQFHAENLALATVSAACEEMTERLGYDPLALARPNPNLLHGETILDWVEARRLSDGMATWVPARMLDLDRTVRDRWMPPLVDTSTNGLASGNTLDEATVHALLEVIERDALAPLTARAPEHWDYIDPATVTGESGELLKRFHRADNTVSIVDVASRTGVPTFLASIWSPTFPSHVQGAGSHLDPDVALCRALTEAAQARIGLISGVRDDLPPFAQRVVTGDRPEVNATLPFQGIEGCSGESLAEDLRELTRRVNVVTGFSPAVVDLTLRPFDLPVVHVIAPGMRFESD